MLRVLFCLFCQNKTLNSAEKNSQYANGCGQSRQRNASFLLRWWEKNAAQWKNQIAAFPTEQGRAQWQKREGRGQKGLLREIFWQQKKKTEKLFFLYCEFYSEQKSLQESSLVRKSMRKKQKVLREIFCTAKRVRKKTKRNNLYILYKMANKIMRIRGNRQGRGEGRQEKHSFTKVQTAKRQRRDAGNYFYKKAEKNSQ